MFQGLFILAWCFGGEMGWAGLCVGGGLAQLWCSLLLRLHAWFQGMSWWGGGFRAHLPDVGVPVMAWCGVLGGVSAACWPLVK